MQLFSCILSVSVDAVFKALADPNRRTILDRLFANNGQTLQELCVQMDMTRQGLSKHLAVLEEAGLVLTEFRGREKFHYLNPVPIREIAERWMDKYAGARAAAVTALKGALEEQDDGKT